MSRTLKTLLFASAVTANTAFAADIPDAGRLLKESTLPPSLAPHKELPTFQNPVTQKELSAGNTMVKVTGFTFVGNTLFSNDELSRLMSGCMGKEMTFAGLNEATAAISNAYRKRGYFLASIFFPPQSVKPGMPLLIEVVEETVAVAEEVVETPVEETPEVAAEEAPKAE